ncbi:radical SAM/SPASM domain-containing protein [Streptomyces antimycoticus]|uniref:radical SAM/SPASM domain-containing protein n=1 Tax=Streptomyces antimycoticus TaxID=68175 RepID=UPI003441516D
MATVIDTTIAKKSTTQFLWLDLTRKCQLACGHCFNSSGPDGTHGTMTREDWFTVLDQGAGCGVRRVQLIGGEPTMHPDGPAIVERALSLGLGVEVYSNLVHVSDKWWELLGREGVSVATSYYSDRAVEHNAMTGRSSHTRTLTNIKNALRLGISLRVGIVAASEVQRVEAARRELEALGVKRVGLDHVRPFGRGAHGRVPEPSGLCGRCGIGKASVGPDGNVSPCVFSAGTMGVGDVRRSPLAAILSGPVMAEARASIRGAVAKGGDEDDDECDPVGDGECSPGYPSSSCSPRN